MDWDKIRKYIIVMLAVVNIMILTSIVRHNNNTSIDNPYFSRKNVANFQSLMEKRGIEVDIELPRDIYVVGSLNTGFRSFNKENQTALFADFDNIRTFSNSKRMQLNLYGASQEIDDLEYDISNADHRVAFAESFLAKYFSSQEYNLRENEDENLLTYKVVYNHFVLEESYVNFEFDSASVKITATDLIPLEKSPTQKQSITSLEAILIALPELSAGDIIESIELVYHFDLPEEDLYKVNDIRSFPNWKITTQGGKEIFVLAM